MARTIQAALAGALKGLEKTLAGEAVPFGFAEDLSYVETFLGLKRPLASYAPRTRRRYVAAAKAHDAGMRQSKARERVTRTTTTKSRYGLSPSQLTRLNKVRLPIMASGVVIDEYLEPQVIREIVNVYGFDYMLKVLTQQLDSINQYVDGSPRAGNRRWHSRGEFEEEARAKMIKQFTAVVYFPNGTDPYYYYHGLRKG